MPSFEELQKKKTALEERLVRLEEKRPQVRSMVYENVRLDYERQLEAVNEEIRRVTANPEKLRQEIGTQLDELETLRRRHEEAALRFELGETQGEQFEEIKSFLHELIADILPQLRTNLQLLGRPVLSCFEDVAAVLDAAYLPTPEELSDNDAVEAYELAAANSPATFETGRSEPATWDLPGQDDAPYDRETARETQPRMTGKQSEAVPPSSEPGENALDTDSLRRRRRLDEDAPTPLDYHEPSDDEIGRSLADLPSEAGARGGTTTSEHKSSGRQRRRPLTFEEVLNRKKSDLKRARREASSVLTEPWKPTVEDLPLVLIIGVNDREEFFSLQGYSSVRIGRAQDNEITVTDDSSVSRYHAEIKSAGVGFELVDLKSSNGTMLNGTRISTGELGGNDIIGLGRTTLIFINDVEDLDMYL
jgi:hypothetical protein